MKHISRERMVSFFQTRSGKPARLGEILEAFQLPKEKRSHVKHMLESLISKGDLELIPGRRYRMAHSAPTQKREHKHSRSFERRKEKHSSKKQSRSKKFSSPQKDANYSVHDSKDSIVTGTLSTHPKGFAFLTPSNGSPDVFIHKRSQNFAFHGDVVEARAWQSPKGRDGKVLHILKRRDPSITGRLIKKNKKHLFEPDDPRFPSPMQVEGNVPKKITEQDAVLAHVVRWPNADHPKAAVQFINHLGKQGAALVEVEKIKIREGLVEDFQENTLKEARVLPTKVLPNEKKQREDLKQIPFVTIDPADAKDHDDAIAVKKLKDGSYEVWVAIADVSHYVGEGTPMDQEAFRRGCSVYLPDRVISMLPKELSTHMASLKPNKVRLCLALRMHLGARGGVKSHRIVEGVMRSRGHLTYESVAHALGLTKQGSSTKQTRALRPMLRDLHTLSRALRTKRLKRGALTFDFPESRIEIHPQTGEPVRSYQTRSDPGVLQAYSMIEELMLLTNEVVARDLSKRQLPTLYRVHDKPDIEKFKSFARVAQQFGHDVKLEMLEQPKEIAQFLTQLEGKSYASILHYLLLRAMQQATYDTQNIGHFGLAAEKYLHFTSPIRRYPDLLVHRMVRKAIRKEPVDIEGDLLTLNRAGAQASLMERKAMMAERDVKDIYKVLLMTDHVGETFKGSISGISEQAFFVSLNDPYVEVRVPVTSLKADYFEMNDIGTSLVGRNTKQTWSLGDEVEVLVEEANLTSRQILATPTQTSSKQQKRNSKKNAKNKSPDHHKQKSRRTSSQKDKSRTSKNTATKKQRGTRRRKNAR